MTDHLHIHAPSTNAQVHTGKGLVAGVIITNSSATAAAVALYDYAGAGPPVTKIFEVMVAAPQPVIIFFSDRLAPRFAAGLWLISAANVYTTLFIHMATT